VVLEGKDGAGVFGISGFHKDIIQPTAIKSTPKSGFRCQLKQAVPAARRIRWRPNLLVNRLVPQYLDSLPLIHIRV
jgi:hypothetical protein